MRRHRARFVPAVKPRYALSIIRNPAGTYSLVGSIPVSLCFRREATRADILAGRSYVAGDDGKRYALDTPLFATVEEAVAYCKERGETPDTPADAERRARERYVSEGLGEDVDHCPSDNG